MGSQRVIHDWATLLSVQQTRAFPHPIYKNKGLQTQVYVGLSPFAGHLKLSQHCLLICYGSESGSVCPTLCDSMDYGILQAWILEWVAFPFSRGSSQPRDRTQVSRIAGRVFTSWAMREAQEYWSGQSIPSPGDLPHPGSNQGLLHCGHIFYLLSHQGSPKEWMSFYLLWQSVSISKK